VVESVFFGFTAARVERALPAAWAHATPAQALAARLDGAAAALRQLLGDPATVDEAAELAWAASQAADVAGRPLAAANQCLPRPADPYAALWQATTTLREHRGDGHNCVLVALGVGPAQAHIVKAASREADGEMLRTGRGIDDTDWSAAIAALESDGHLDGQGRLTHQGWAFQREIEHRTDLAAALPWRQLGARASTRLLELLSPLAEAIRTAGLLPFPNPAGLTLPDPG
jgi:hypothetical protein